jgi:zinc protease
MVHRMMIWRRGPRLMTGCRLMVALCVGCLGLTAFAMASAKDAILPVQHWQRDGLAVYFVPAPEVPLAKVVLLFKGGAMYDSTPGMAYVTASMLDQGSGKLDAQAIAERFESQGIELGAGSDLSHAWLAWQCTTDSWDQAATWVPSLLKDISFPATAMARIKTQMLRAITARQQSAQQSMALAFRKTIYGDKAPLGHSLLGNVKSVKRLQRKAMVRFYQQHYGVSQAALLVVGKVSKQQVDALAHDLGQVLPQAKSQPLNIRHRAYAKPATKVHVPFNSQQTHVVVGQSSLTVGDPDFYPLLLANHILGGDMLGSRLFMAIREQRGLAYAVSSSLQVMPQQHTLWAMGLQTKSQQAKQARQLLLDTAKKFIDQGPTDQEMVSAKRYLVGAFPLYFDSTSARMARLLWLVKQQLPLDRYDHYVTRVESITKPQVMAAMKKHWRPNNWQVMTLGRSA